MAEAATTDYTPVSVEAEDGKILTGIGVSAESLEAAIDASSLGVREDSTEAPAEPPTTEPTPAAPPEQPRDDTGKFQKRTHGQKRFAQLTGEREAAERARVAAEQERDTLKAELERLKAAPAQGMPTSPTSVPQPPPHFQPSPPPQGRPKPTEDQIGTVYQSYPDFIEDLADWKAEQRLAGLNLDAQIRDRIEADRASRTLQDQITASIAEAKQVYPDFDALMRSPVLNPQLWSPDKLRAVQSHPKSAFLACELAKHPDVAQRLMQADPITFGFELAKLAPPASAVASSPASTASGSVMPPPPYQPVAAGSKTTVTPSADLAKRGFDFDKSGYRERRAAERGVRRVK